MTRPRLPIAPLVRLVERAGGCAAASTRTGLDNDRLDRLRAAYHRGRKAGEVTVGIADELAIRFLGLHPALVWGDAWWWQPPSDRTETQGAPDD